jgi:ABC-type phosphate/phosphonate transport system permease subunit
MATEKKECVYDLNDTVRSFLDGTKNFFSLSPTVSSQAGAYSLGMLFHLMAIIIMICGIIPAIPFAIMMAISLSVCKWFFYKFRTL